MPGLKPPVHIHVAKSELFFSLGGSDIVSSCSACQRRRDTRRGVPRARLQAGQEGPHQSSLPHAPPHLRPWSHMVPTHALQPPGLFRQVPLEMHSWPHPLGTEQ